MSDFQPSGRSQFPNALTKRQVRLRLALVVLALVVLGVGGYALATVPPTAESWYPKCTLHSATGLHCPGCGTTRAAHALLNGHISQALAYNAVIFIIFPVLLWLQFGPARGRRRVMWFAVGLIVAFGIARNIPVYPFSLLAPTELP